MLELIHALGGLPAARELARAAAMNDNLVDRANRLLVEIDAIHRKRQRLADRFITRWCREREVSTRQYLVMARLLLAQAFDMSLRQ